MEGTASLEEWGALARGPGRREGPGFAAGPVLRAADPRARGTLAESEASPARGSESRTGQRASVVLGPPAWSREGDRGDRTLVVHGQPLRPACHVGRGGAGSGQSCPGSPWQAPAVCSEQWGLCSERTEFRGTLEASPTRPCARRLGRGAGARESELETGSSSSATSYLAGGTVGSSDRRCAPSWPRSGRPPGPLRRLSLRAQPPWLLDPCSRDLRTLTSSSVIGSRFSVAQKRLPRALLSPPPPRGLPLRPCPGGWLSAAQLCPRRAWRHSAASAGHSSPELLRTFRGQGWGARPWRARHRPARRSAGLGKAGGDGLLRVLLFEEGARALGGGPGRGGRWGTLTPPEWPGQEACARQGPFPSSAGPRSSPRCVGEDRGPRGV